MKTESDEVEEHVPLDGTGLGAAAEANVPASPYKSAVADLESLRKTFRTACQHYGKRIDQEIVQLREQLVAEGQRQPVPTGPKVKAGSKRRESPANSRMHDLRDMITLLRTLEVKPAAGRRKDLKKIESVVGELRLLLERWG